MSDARSGKGGDSGGRGGGSVRRAREQMEAGDRGMRSIQDSSDQARSSDMPPQGSRPIRRPLPTSTTFKSPDNAGKADVISQSATAPQWPLSEERADSRQVTTTSNESVNFSKRPAPQRPARPDSIPSSLDAPPSSLQQQQHSQSMAQNLKQIMISTDSASGPADSGFSDLAPLAEPTPVANVPPLRGNPTTHPPPSTRRTGSSYYSGTAFVSPIPEEPPEILPRKGGSYASSKVIPSSWGTAPPDADIPQWSDEDFLNDDDKPSDSLVRQASLGKRGKASLRTINKAHNDQPPDNNQAPTVATDKSSDEKVAAVAIGMAVSANPKVMEPAYKGGNTRGQPESRPSDDYASSLSSDDDYEKPPIPIMRFETKSTKPILKKAESRGSNISPGGNERRRPPQIDMDAVRQAEARGSLTSLPELIRRATRLATNLDHGKTASRFGISDILNASEGHRGRNSGSISDILASFPPPAIAAPAGDDQFPGTFTNTDPRSRPDAEGNPEKRPRRCCGLPVWAVLLILLISLAIISIAVIIPVQLTVLRQPAQPASGPPPPENCQATDPCMNGGISVGNPGSCGCVCVDGFGGDKCAIAGDNSCTTINVSNEPSGFQNATLGTALPRLIEDSQANFSIPLDTSRILRLFNRESVSCTSQNALVMFNGASRKRSEQTISQRDTTRERSPDGTDSPTPTIAARESIRDRNIHNHALSGRQQAFNRDPPSHPTRSFKAPSATPTNDPSQPPLSAKILDFSRIAVLFIFEETEDLVDAVHSHDSIQAFFQDVVGESGRQMGLMGVNCTRQDFILDFVKFTIGLDNGTIVGGGM
ncbi:hypothetical protein ACJ72_06664 [Emergomyces africanus]|uniref:EGF-like domain-containing protein n=1 Tax=Emergomyces africanus TaxID=1955775 RepID=A0A1B7NQB2_9EURO|nr:hypothetical protein ACJ72_06664 [Emergomyces africanus]